MNIRKATIKDIYRISEIEVFNYRLNFYPIFKNDKFYFKELQVNNLLDRIKQNIDNYYVYDDGVVKGFFLAKNSHLMKLFVEPVLQNNHIGKELFEYAIKYLDIEFLWALEKNIKAIKFYISNGFKVTTEKKIEEGSEEYLVKLIRK